MELQHTTCDPMLWLEKLIAADLSAALPIVSRILY